MSNPGNVIGGHKANLNNPNTSEESKQHSKEVIENNGGEVDQSSSGQSSGGQSSSDDTGKNPNNVAGGLKATLKNPNVSQEAKDSAESRLKEM
ncbi:MAG: hypothetical protein LQ347_006800 [Umbilicaria vellea]|nr:MAG: hypothetical protein LQ347_006800 [Umbilicaria vellea]